VIARLGVLTAVATLVLPSSNAAAQAPTATASLTTGSIRLDGVLDEPAWSLAAPIEPFFQRDPKEGAPASEETEVRVLFDAESLYVGVTCRDRTPTAIVATQLARDASLEVDDRVLIVLDPFLDHRNGFFFAVNPLGARADGQSGARRPIARLPPGREGHLHVRAYAGDRSPARRVGSRGHLPPEAVRRRRSDREGKTAAPGGPNPSPRDSSPEIARAPAKPSLIVESAPAIQDDGSGGEPNRGRSERCRHANC
jgi:hypothetical protein